jgi:putative endonuclease
LITLYVLRGKTGKRYVGITNDLSRRIYEHRLKKSKAGQLLDEFQVLYTEEFPDHGAARRRERFLKSGQGRKWIDELALASEPARGAYEKVSQEKTLLH